MWGPPAQTSSGRSCSSRTLWESRHRRRQSRQGLPGAARQPLQTPELWMTWASGCWESCGEEVLLWRAGFMAESV